MNIIRDESELLCPLDPLEDLWPLYQGIIEHQTINMANDPTLIDVEACEELIGGTVQQQQIETAEPGRLVVEKGLKKMMKISSISSNSKKKREIMRRRSSIIVNNGNEGESSSLSVAKKLDHNAKERIRRMKLNASYLALRALLPDSRRSKKRWGAPSVVDKVLKYIPELENQIEELESKKEEMQSEANKNNPKITINNNNNIENVATSRYPIGTPTVSVRGVDEDEAIVQICMDHAAEGDDGSEFTKLLQRMEDEGISVKSASTVCIGSQTKITSYYLHIQMNKVWDGVEYSGELKDKIMSWLRNN